MKRLETSPPPKKKKTNSCGCWTSSETLNHRKSPSQFTLVPSSSKSSVVPSSSMRCEVNLVNLRRNRPAALEEEVLVQPLKSICARRFCCGVAWISRKGLRSIIRIKATQDARIRLTERKKQGEKYSAYSTSLQTSTVFDWSHLNSHSRCATKQPRWHRGDLMIDGHRFPILNNNWYWDMDRKDFHFPTSKILRFSSPLSSQPTSCDRPSETGEMGKTSEKGAWAIALSRTGCKSFGQKGRNEGQGLEFYHQHGFEFILIVGWGVAPTWWCHQTTGTCIIYIYITFQACPGLAWSMRPVSWVADSGILETRDSPTAASGFGSWSWTWPAAAVWNSVLIYIYIYEYI